MVIFIIVWKLSFKELKIFYDEIFIFEYSSNKIIINNKILKKIISNLFVIIF